MNINQLLDLTIHRVGSDLHLVVGYPPMIRVNGELLPVAGEPVLTSSQIDSVMVEVMNPTQQTKFKEDWEIDFSVDFQGKARFRVNFYRQKGTIAADFRLIPNDIPELADLGLPEVVKGITNLKQGFILVTGP